MSWSRSYENFQALHETNLYIYSLPYAPAEIWKTLSADEVDQVLDCLNQAIADEFQASGLALVMSTRFRGRTVLRLSIFSPRTTPVEIDAVFNRMAELGKGLQNEHPPGVGSRADAEGDDPPQRG